MSLKKNILKIFSVNILSMISGILISFLVPALLSVTDFANLKTFNFYLSYTSILSLGFVDGMYIKYGGKSISSIDKSELKSENITFFFIQFIFSIIFFLIGIISKDVIIILLSFSIIPFAIYGFFTMFYQSIGDFNKYSKIVLFYTIFNLTFNIIFTILFKSTNYLIYCLIPTFVNLIITIYLEFNFLKKFKEFKFKFQKEIMNNIKVGFFILIGNLSVILFYGIDRWFIKFFYTSNDFAYYSFAISMLNLINLLVSAISVTFYNHIAKNENKEELKTFKKYLIILGTIASLSYFGFAFIVNIFLKKYILSLNIIAISFASYPYMIVINALFVNIYKVRKNEKKYLKVVILMLIISTIYNTIAMLLSHSTSSIAIATTFSFITWYFYSSRHFDYLKPDKNEILFLFINLIFFLFISNTMNWFIGGISYLIIILLTIFIFFRKDLIEFKLSLSLIIKKFKRKEDPINE
ncbi:capsular biosynthesis protein [Clostridium perfringens]|uniref:capsular biosynthesis protein n=2 Tax=Clostridium perfringens TaxID=1502 RepID=UPI00263B1BD8|nr:capsular biosynthesis protein [Clostridium perfringens]MDN4737052.1 capsular biosynthesis protein [Clostridium perfringens]MDN4740557.1 capsular biosynthesis protein [Clostridium perfringens]